MPRAATSSTTSATDGGAAGSATARNHGSDLVTDGVRVTVRPSYLALQSSPADKRFLFSYAVTIRNEGSTRVRLATRHWRIVDADGEAAGVADGADGMASSDASSVAAKTVSVRGKACGA